MKLKGYGAGCEIYLADDGSYIDEHGHPVEQAQLKYGLDVKASGTQYGSMFVYTAAGYEHSQYAPEKLIRQAIPEVERKEVECSYCGHVELRPQAYNFGECPNCGGI